jgi:hypothetical protein
MAKQWYRIALDRLVERSPSPNPQVLASRKRESKRGELVMRKR